MLRSKDGLDSRRVSRGVLMALLLTGVVAVSAVRSPAQKSENDTVKSLPVAPSDTALVYTAFPEPFLKTGSVQNS